MTSDLLGLRPERATLKHVRQYAQIGTVIADALAAYRKDVADAKFP